MQNKIHKIPRLFNWLLDLVITDSDWFNLKGDYEEIYNSIVYENGKINSYFWLTKQIFKSATIYFSDLILWSFLMFKNYLKIALRNLNKHKAYSFVNVFGLAIGLAIFTLCAVMAGFETNADKFHQNAENIYSVVQVIPSGNKGDEHTASTPAPLLSALLSEFPEIQNGCRVFPAGKLSLKYEDRFFYEDKVLFVGLDFFNIFSFELKAGDPLTLLENPNSIVLSEEVANKYFGEENPIGKVLTINNDISVTVTGVIKYFEENYSSLQFDFLISIETSRNLVHWTNDWSVNQLMSFVLLLDGTKPDLLNDKLPAFLNKYYPVSPNTPKQMYLFPLLDVRLHSLHISSFMVRHDIVQPYLLLITGLFLLIIVCINFMNLSTARYMTRMKEIGMRKVVGAHRFQLMKQFLSESIIISLIALPVSLWLYKYITTTLVRIIAGHQGNFIIWNHPFLVKYVIGVTLLVGIFAGSYPAFFLSSFRPARILKGKFQSGKKGSLFRKVLVVSQFTLAIILIVFTMSLDKQYDHIYLDDLGYSREGILAISVNDETRENLKLMQQDFTHHPDILSVSASASLPGRWNSDLKVLPEGINKEDAWTTSVYKVDYNFCETFGINIIQGRNHSRDFNDENNYIINETMARQLQWENPIGKKLIIEDNVGTVIGVSQDFLFRSVTHNISPTILSLAPEKVNFLIIKVSPSSEFSTILGSIKQQWYSYFPNVPFEFITLNDHFKNIYRGGDVFLALFGFTDIVAILIACLGLIGLASYAVERRTKEIGIRKTLGASVIGIIRLLIKDFIFLIALSNLIGLPIAYLLTNYFLNMGYIYNRITIGPGILILTVTITLLTALIAVSSQTFKTARTNPINSLRYE